MSKPKISQIVFLVVIALLIIPQTRLPIQVFLNKGLGLFGPSVIDAEDQKAFVFNNWELQDLNGQQLNISDLEGEVVLLNFWATWCPPCIAEMPSIQKLAEGYSDKIRIVLVSGEKQEVVRAFLKKKGYDLPSYTPLSAYPESLQIHSIPRTLLIDTKGNIVIDKTGAANWNSDGLRTQIDALLKP